jgi:hypothetical protein
MIQLNCNVRDCKYQLRRTCQKPVIEVDKLGKCVSFIHDKSRFRVAEAVPALNANEATPSLSVVKEQ